MLMPRRSAKPLALLLAILLLPLPVHSKGDESDKDKKQLSSPSIQMGRLAGKLVTRGNQPVLVNGNIVGTGTTILTGATIQTFNGTKASVRIGALGDFELAPNSAATLAFSGDSATGQITGIIKRGCARLTANANVDGALTTADGIMTRTDKARLSSVNVCAPGSEDEALVDPYKDLNASNPPDDQRSRGIFGLGANSGTTWGLLSAASYFAGTGTARLVVNANASSHDNGCGSCCCCNCGVNPSPCRP